MIETITIIQIVLLAGLSSRSLIASGDGAGFCWCAA